MPESFVLFKLFFAVKVDPSKSGQIFGAQICWVVDMRDVCVAFEVANTDCCLSSKCSHANLVRFRRSVGAPPVTSDSRVTDVTSRLHQRKLLGEGTVFEK